MYAGDRVVNLANTMMREVSMARVVHKTHEVGDAVVLRFACCKLRSAGIVSLEGLNLGFGSFFSAVPTASMPVVHAGVTIGRRCGKEGHNNMGMKVRMLLCGKNMSKQHLSRESVSRWQMKWEGSGLMRTSRRKGGRRMA